MTEAPETEARESLIEHLNNARFFIQDSLTNGHLSSGDVGNLMSARDEIDRALSSSPLPSGGDSAQSQPGCDDSASRDASAGAEPSAPECHGLDTPERVCFYEQDFYPLSNFSSFAIIWPLNAREGLGRFDTSEALYHWLKFSGQAQPKRVPTSDQWAIAAAIRAASSAHEAFKIAERHRSHRRLDWDEIKVGAMREIIRAKADQHEYVRRKLLATGDRELVENSWRDDFWGWGPNRDGQNMLGKLWMELRAELRAATIGSAAPPNDAVGGDPAAELGPGNSPSPPDRQR